MGISPKEAFDALRILWPATNAITKPVGSIAEIKVYPLGDYPYTLGLGQTVDWGTTTEYPLPEPKWRDARPEDLVFPWKEVWVRGQNHPTPTKTYLCGIGYDANGKPMYVTTDGITHSLVEIKEDEA